MKTNINLKLKQMKSFMHVKKNLVLILLISILITFSYQNCNAQQRTYERTQVIPYLSEKIDPVQNIVYANSFLSAWGQLKDVLGGDIRLKQQIYLEKYLNEYAIKSANDENYVAMGGFVKNGIIEKINKELKSKFRLQQTNLNVYKDKSDVIICYAYFQKKLKFDTEFQSLNKPYPFYYNGKQTKVECFGINSNIDNSYKRNLLKQVEIIDYRNNRDFIIRLKGRNQDEEIILAKVDLGKTLEITIDNIKEKIRNSKWENLKNDDVLIIPKIDFSIEHSYKLLLGKHLANKGFEDYFFDRAEQNIKFELNESGASVASQAEIVLKKGRGPRYLLFDKPFLLIMKSKSEEKPYFALWIADPEFLFEQK